MKKILVTGFDPFGGEIINPSYEAVKNLPDNIAGATIIKLELPTVFRDSINTVVAAMDKHQPDSVICIGQLGGLDGLAVEKVAVNLDNATIVDNQGHQPINQLIYQDGKDNYVSNLPVEKMVTAINSGGITASLSYSAGTFVCNHTLYGVLYHIDKKEKFKNITAGFIHVPFLPEQITKHPGLPFLSLIHITAGLEIAIRTVIKEENTNDILPLTC